ncbi:MAG: hypothetical protein A2V79_05800 [Betaproteobacteria bacterium RBG_16_56_24]|nr:MAG: hypothetical protein A2V79_05800 [Betaproteobacteria bacterium RBG_16_56_24]
MKCSLLLFLSADRLHAQLMAGGKIAMQRNFTDSPEGREDFASFLQTAKHPAYLLTDLIEEDFRHETVPHLSGRNRTASLQRKFDQFYRGTPFHQATLLQRQKTGRRDDDMLFSALTNPSLITPWLNIMLAQQMPLAGIYSVPQISAPLVRDHPSSHLLLISWERSAGLRQTYFSEHRLQISRLTPVHADLTFHDAVVNELARTYQYLKSLSLLPLGQTLDVRILCHRNDRAELESRKQPDNADMRYDFADIADIAAQLRIDHHFTDSDASQIFLHQLAASPPKTHYANATHTRYFTLWRLKRFLNLASGVLLLGMALWSAGKLWQGGSNATEAASLKQQAQRTLNEAQKIILAFPNTYAPAADMKAGVIVKHKLDQYAPSPQDILGPISAALGRHRQIELDDISWKMDATEPVIPPPSGGRPGGGHAEVPAQVITLKGHLADFANDYRAMLNYLEHFQSDLTAQGFQVTSLTKPLDVSPGGSIADKRETSGHMLDFSLKISRRPSI